ncbi:MAG: DegV family protein [Lachnospiraceae bacterium]
MKVAVLTDTNSGIYMEEAGQLGIYIMPMPVIIDDEVYYEGDNLTEKQFYEALAGGRRVTTSQPSPGNLLAQWDELLENYEQVVYIPMSSGLSNSCSAAMGLADEYGDRVQIVDNHRISVTLRQSVMTARTMAEEGKGAKSIKEFLEKEAYHSSIYVAVNTLEYLKKGGRITPAAAMIGSVLSIKPVLTIQGEKLDSFVKVRGTMKKCELKMLEAMKADIQNRFADIPVENLHIGTAGAGLDKKEQEEWKTMVKDAFPESDVFYNPLSASIAAHTGPGAVGIGVTVY